VSRQQDDPTEVQPTVAEHGQERRVLPGGPRDGDPEVRLVLPEMQDLPTVVEHRRARFPRVQLPRVDLADVRHDVGLDPPGVPRELGEAAEQRVVRELGEIQCLCHAEGERVRLPREVRCRLTTEPSSHRVPADSCGLFGAPEQPAQPFQRDDGGESRGT
jgi:hypothetical protein